MAKRVGSHFQKVPSKPACASCARAYRYFLNTGHGTHYFDYRAGTWNPVIFIRLYKKYLQKVLPAYLPAYLPEQSQTSTNNQFEML